VKRRTGGREDGRRRKANAELKSKTPHVNVGNKPKPNIFIFYQQIL
jgi:hypothetical protein